MAKFSLIIPCFNNLVFTQHLWTTLLMYGPLGPDIEYVFVDDCSTDTTLAWLEARQGQHFQVVRSPTNRGFSSAVNSGVRASNGQFVVLLNNDLVLTRDWFVPFNQVADHWPANLGVLGNVQRRVDNHAVDHCGVLVTHQGQLRHAHNIPNEDYTDHDLVTGACMMFTRSLFERLGGLDERYLNGGEDIDFCFKALALGLTNRVANKSQIFHHVGATRGINPKEFYNLRLLYGRWYTQLAVCMFKQQKLLNTHAKMSQDDCTQTLLHELNRIERQADFF